MKGHCVIFVNIKNIANKFWVKNSTDKKMKIVFFTRVIKKETIGQSFEIYKK